MIRIGFLTNTLEIGGVEKYVVDLCNRLDKDCFSPTIINFGGGAQMLSFLTANNTHLVHLNKKPGNDLSLSFKIAKVCRQEKIHILHSNNWGTLLEAGLARLISPKTRWLHVQHGMEYNIRKDMSYFRRVRQSLSARVFLRFASAIVSVSNASRSFLETSWGVKRANLSVVHNGVELNAHYRNQDTKAKKRRELCISNDAQIIVSVGRQDPVKNYSCLIDAFAIYGNSHPSARLVLIGDGVESHRIENQIRALNLGDQVLCLGRRNDVAELLVACDLFVLPSLSEGMPLSILEALSAGLPVVATNVGGIPEIVDDSVGALVTSDCPPDMAKEIQTCLSTPENLQCLSEAARNRVEQSFSLDTMVSAYEALYKQLA